ncbi:hypothetical protein Peur_046421 [Populus x canadensis]
MYMLCTRPIFNSDICFDRILEQGKASLFSREGMTQLQCLMFVLASFHCVSSILTLSLGMAILFMVI